MLPIFKSRYQEQLFDMELGSEIYFFVEFLFCKRLRPVTNGSVSRYQK